jgi:HD-like signal output (HDOD) protein
MDKVRKIELIQRSLGLRHKLKVHESMKAPETHDEMSIMLLAKWELEDELRAIEDVLSEARQKNVSAKKAIVLKEEALPEGVASADPSRKKKSKK